MSTGGVFGSGGGVCTTRPEDVWMYSWFPDRDIEICGSDDTPEPIESRRASSQVVTPASK